MADLPRDKLLTAVADLYSKSVSEHGTVAMGVGWKSEDQQRLRFDKLVQVIDADRPYAISINDLGCGYAAMFPYLDRLLGPGMGRYYGYDISTTMLEAARRYITDPRAEFIQSQGVTEEADYSFVSGTFNVRLDASDQEWTTYIKETLLALASKSRRGLAFNVFTTHVDWKQDNLYYADPLEFFDFCRRNISRYVTLLHDYPLYEWTMIVRTNH